MAAVLLLACLLAVASGRPQTQDGRLLSLFSGREGGFSGFSGGADTQVSGPRQLESSYIPPTGGGTGGGSTVLLDCPQDQIVTVPRVSTIVQEVVNTVEVPVVRTKYVTSTRLVPSVVTSTVVLTNVVTSTVYNTRIQTQYDQQRVVSTVRLPDTYVTSYVTVYNTVYNTRAVTSTVLVTRRQLQTSYSTVYSTAYRESTVQVPQVVVRTSVLQVPGPAQTRLQTVYRTSQLVSTVLQQPRTIVQTRTNVQTRVVARTVREPDQLVTVTSVQVIPATSVLVSTQYVPQVNTLTRTVAQTRTQTQVTTQVVQVPTVVVRTVQSTLYNTQYVTQTRPVVVTKYREVVQTVPVPGQPQVLARTQLVQVTSTVQLPDQYVTQVVQVPRQKEVFSTRYVQQVVPQEQVVTKRVPAKCGYNYHHRGYKY